MGAVAGAQFGPLAALLKQRAAAPATLDSLALFATLLPLIPVLLNPLKFVTLVGLLVSTLDVVTGLSGGALTLAEPIETWNG